MRCMMRMIVFRTLDRLGFVNVQKLLRPVYRDVLRVKASTQEQRREEKETISMERGSSILMPLPSSVTPTVIHRT